MQGQSIASYIDSGSIGLFATQITEALGNVHAIAIHDTDGQLAWVGADQGGKSPWPLNPFKREAVPGVGFCERLDNGRFAYVFYLHCGDDDVPSGTLSVQIDGSHPISLESAHAEIASILNCIERQIEINAELSAVRRVTRESRKGLELLMRMDELAEEADPQEALRKALEMVEAHFASELTAVLMPELGIHEVRPEALVQDESTSKAVMSTLGSLIASAKLHRQVLLSDANLKTKVVAGLNDSSPKVLCCPIVNARDDVIGVMVLIGPASFTKDQVRLSRAVCAKLRTLLRDTNQINEDHLSRHGFLRHTAGVMTRHAERRHAVLYLDVDKLHVVNDTHGHMAGDLVIRTVSRVIDEVARSDDAVSHLNGDNFAIFLRDSDENTAREKAEHLLGVLAGETTAYDDQEIQVTASIGVALIPDVVKDAAAALNTAEVAARSAKHRGGNRVVIFKDLDASVAQRRSDLDQVNHLQAALIANRFELYAQPIAALDENENRHRYEILIRMRGDDGEHLPPDKFLPAAERYQMMASIDRWVVRNTLDQLGGAENLLDINLASFSINVSAQSLADPDFLEYLENQITESGVAPDTLCFEITETAVVRNLERAQRTIRRLQRLGCRLALDDFGTGYCSFAYLKDLPVQYIKVDGTFVRDILENPLSEAIVAAISNIAKVRNCATVAEHVENDLVIQRLRQHDIDFVQGFAIGRPVPLGEALAEMGPPAMQIDVKKTGIHQLR